MRPLSRQIGEQPFYLAICLKDTMYPLLLVATALAGCADDFDGLVRKIEQNYAGFRLEVTGPRRISYDRMRDSLRTRALSAEGDECFFVLRALADWFDDPHLFVFQSTRLDTAETTRRAATVERTALVETDIRARLARSEPGRDPLEGIWSDGRVRVGVVPDPAGFPVLLGVVLTSDSSIWPAGAVRARFIPRGDGRYDGVVWERNMARRVVRATLHKRVLLRLSPGMWGREFPIATPDSGLVDPVNPHHATIRIRGGTVVLSIPSHDPSYRRVLDSLIDRHASDLRNAERLIVDLRGNEGGSSLMTARLLPYLDSEERRPSVLPDWPAVMLSSEDQITYIQRFWVGGQDTAPPTQRLLVRLRANPGALVPLEDSLYQAEPPRRDSVIRGPARIGLIIDRGTVSAAEAFLVWAMRSTRVTVFGENTAGALDYQSVYIVPFQAERPSRWLLGYPTITAHARLPERGIRGRGIPPQVRLDLNRERDVIATVERMLNGVTSR